MFKDVKNRRLITALRDTARRLRSLNRIADAIVGRVAIPQALASAGCSPCFNCAQICHSQKRCNGSTLQCRKYCQDNNSREICSDTGWYTCGSCV